MSFVSDYISYAQDCTDAPVEYHEALAYFIMSTLIGPRIRMDLGQNGLYPVVWVALIGKSGVHRKSTALSIAQNLIMEVDPLAVIGNQASEKQLIEFLGGQNSACMVYGEFSRIFHAPNSMRSLLLEFFDCPPFIPGGRLKAGMDIHYPFLNIASAATTIPHYEDTGLLPRFLHVYPGVYHETKALQGKKDDDKHSKLISRLTQLKVREGKFNYTPEAVAEYRKWYSTEIDARLSDYVHKIALLRFVDENPEGFEIPVSYVEMGIEFVEALLKRKAQYLSVQPSAFA